MENEEGKKMNGPNAGAGGADAGQYEDYQVPYDENEPTLFFLPLFFPTEAQEKEHKAVVKYFAGRMKDDAPLALQLRREEPCGMVYNPQKFKGLYNRNEIPMKELSAFVKMLQYHVAKECFAIEQLGNEFLDYRDRGKLPSLNLAGHYFGDIELFFEAIQRMPKAECEGGVYFLDLNDFATRYDNCPSCIHCDVWWAAPNGGQLDIKSILLDVFDWNLEQFVEVLGEYQRKYDWCETLICAAEDLITDISKDLRDELIPSNTLDWDRIKEIHDTIMKHVREFDKACAVAKIQGKRLGYKDCDDDEELKRPAAKRKTAAKKESRFNYEQRQAIGELWEAFKAGKLEAKIKPLPKMSHKSIKDFFAACEDIPFDFSNVEGQTTLKKIGITLEEMRLIAHAMAQARHNLKV